MPKRTRAHKSYLPYIGGCLLAIIGIPTGLILLWVFLPYILAGIAMVLTLAVVVITLTNGLFSQGR